MVQIHTPFILLNGDYFETLNGEIFNVINFTEEFTLQLFNNSAEVNRVDKTPFLNNVGILQGTLRKECSIENPLITIELNDIPRFNYVYIPHFNRYYFVNRITNIINNLWEIELKCDVLMSYKDIIYKQSCLIERQEKNYNPYLIDDYSIAENRSQITISEFINLDFFNLDNNVDRIVLTIAKK